MERLTERAEIDKCPGIWVKEGFANEGNKTWFNRYDEGYLAISKLADYEDLEERLQNVYGEHSGLLNEVVTGLERHEKIDLPQQIIKSRLLTDEDVDKWEKYKRLEDQGIFERRE